jgi:hypothetical protein
MVNATVKHGSLDDGPISIDGITEVEFMQVPALPGHDRQQA